MALVRKMTRRDLETVTRHSEVDATFSIVQADAGEQLLQIDTYGSAGRKYPGKVSQSVRFSREAMLQLAELLRGML